MKIQVKKTPRGYKLVGHLGHIPSFFIDANTTDDEGTINMCATGSITGDEMTDLQEMMDIALLLAQGRLEFKTN